MVSQFKLSRYTCICKVKITKYYTRHSPLDIVVGIHTCLFVCLLRCMYKPCMHVERIRVITIPAALKSVEDAVILVEGAEPTPEIVMDSVDLHRPRVHVYIPYLVMIVRET